MKIDLYDNKGAKAGDVAVSAAIFGAKVNPDLMHRAVVMRLANARNPIAHTQTRGDVAGTTKKAFRQKGTGNARRGALKTTLLRGGAPSHGPKNNANFSKAMPKKERRAALFSSLSAKAGAKSVFALDKFASKLPKTKDFVSLLEKLPQGKKYLFVLTKEDDVLKKSLANVPNVNAIHVSYLNPYDVLQAEQVCFLKDSLSKLEEIFLASSK